MHYSVKPTLVQMALSGSTPKVVRTEPEYAISLTDAPCSVTNRSL
jgi:hypothetical protein